MVWETSRENGSTGDGMKYATRKKTKRLGEVALQQYREVGELRVRKEDSSHDHKSRKEKTGQK